VEERRKQLVKQASEKVEEARIALRGVRQDALKDAKRRKETKELSEDDVKAVEKEIDRLMAQHQATIEAAFAACGADGADLRADGRVAHADDADDLHKAG